MSQDPSSRNLEELNKKPHAKLMLALMVLMGGCVTQDQILNACMKWEDENGEVTIEKVNAWIADNRIDISKASAIGQALRN